MTDPTSLATLATAFAAGLLSVLSPCVMPLMPAYLSLISGVSVGELQDLEAHEDTALRRRVMKGSLGFVAGFSAVFVLLGASATVIGRTLGTWEIELLGFTISFVQIAGVIVILMGLHLMEVFTIPIPSMPHIKPRFQGLAGAFALGLMFGVVSAPCAAPMLVVLLTYLAGSNSSVLWGGVLLLAYALGHSVLILLAGTSMGFARILIENKKATTPLKWLRRTSGVVVVLVGLYFGYRGL